MNHRCDWLHIMNSAVFSAPLLLYPILVNALPTLIKRPYGFKRALLAWNLFQTGFSLIVFAMIAPAFAKLLWNDGYAESVCQDKWENHWVNTSYGWWVYLFLFSKIWDVVDTVFIMVNNKPVRFIHWYHHWATMLSAYFGIMNSSSVALWCVVMNSFIHTLLYSHYSLTPNPDPAP